MPSSISGGRGCPSSISVVMTCSITSAIAPLAGCLFDVKGIIVSPRLGEIGKQKRVASFRGRRPATLLGCSWQKAAAVFLRLIRFGVARPYWTKRRSSIVSLELLLAPRRDAVAKGKLGRRQPTVPHHPLQRLICALTVSRPQVFLAEKLCRHRKPPCRSQESATHGGIKDSLGDDPRYETIQKWS